MSKISVQHLNLWYGEKHALKDTNLEIEELVLQDVVSQHS